MLSGYAGNNNPQGKNQYGILVKADDPVLKAALTAYHHELLTDNEQIAQRLLKEHNIVMSAATVKRRRRNLGLTGSRITSNSIPEEQQVQMVLDEMRRDPARRQGPRLLRSRVAFNTGVHLKRDFVSSVMRGCDPQGFELREPTAKKIRRFPKVPLGINERWSADGHDKLNRIGFQIWAIVDDGSGKLLNAWLVPSNRHAQTIGYLLLCQVEASGGIPLQFTTDHGSETTRAYGLVNALREIFHPDFDRSKKLPAHVYLQSIHNISIERSWLRFRILFGDNAVMFFEQGIHDGIYNDQDPNHVELCNWLWAKVLRKELRNHIDLYNSVKTRKDRNKCGPSGMSRNHAYACPETWGGKDYILPVDTAIISELKAAVGGDAILEFSTPEFSVQAEEAYSSLEIVNLTLENTWDAFQSLLYLLHPDMY